jgi:predicted transcriptional regulator
MVLRAGQTASSALAALRAAGIMGAPVTDTDDIYLGTADRDRLAALLRADAGATLDSGIDNTVGTVSHTADLGEAIDALLQAGGQWVTVTDDQRHVTGILTAGAVVRAYRDAVQAAAPASEPSAFG